MRGCGRFAKRCVVVGLVVGVAAGGVVLPRKRVRGPRLVRLRARTRRDVSEVRLKRGTRQLLRLDEVRLKAWRLVCIHLTLPRAGCPGEKL